MRSASSPQYAKQTAATTGLTTPLGRPAEARRSVLRQAARIRRQGSARSRCSSKYNADPPSVTVCLLTSHLVESRLRVRIDPTAENGLDKPSQVMIDKVMTLPLDRLDNRIGAASRAQLEAIS